MYKEFTLNDDETGLLIGSYEAHLNVSKNDEVIFNYFINKQHMERETLKIVLNKVKEDKISILMNINVDKDYQEQGYGQYLLNKMMMESKYPIVLICDGSLDFLESWYERNGFEFVASMSGLSVMIRF